MTEPRPPSILNEVVTLLDAAVVGWLFVSTRGTILWQSRHCVKWMGYTQAELIGRNVFEFIDPRQRAIQRRLFDRMVARPGQLGAPSKLRWRRRDGSFAVLIARAVSLLHTPVQSIVVNYWPVDYPLGFNGGGD